MMIQLECFPEEELSHRDFVVVIGDSLQATFERMTYFVQDRLAQFLEVFLQLVHHLPPGPFSVLFARAC